MASPDAVNLLVTDAHLPQSYAIIRSLRPYCRRIIVTGSGRWQPPFYSKYIDKAYRVPTYDRASAYLNAVLEVCDEEQITFLFPSYEKSLLLFAQNIDLFRERGITSTIPSFDTLVRAMDKYSIMKIAERIGVPTPKTLALDEIADLREAVAYLGTPIVVKPRIGTGGQGITYANSVEELEKKISRVIQEGFGALALQEYIPPYLTQSAYFPIGVTTVLDHDHEPRAVITTTEKGCLRTFSGIGGGSVTTATIQSNPQTTNYTIKLLKEMKSVGPSMVQFKIDSRDNVPKLLEVNCRLPGKTSLRTAAGIDLPLLTFRVMRGDDVNVQHMYRQIDGIYGFGLDQELRFFIGYLKAIRDGHLHTPPFAPRPSQILRNVYTTYTRRHIHFGFSLRDLGPWIARILEYTFEFAGM